MKTYRFGIRDTPKGAVAWMESPSGRKQEKRFRNGYAGARITAQKWIDSQVEVIREMESVEGSPEANIVQTHKRGRPATGKTPPRQLGRMSDEDYETICRAAELLGKSRTAFMSETLLKRAKRVIREYA